MKDLIIHALGFSAMYAGQLVADVSPEQMVAQPIKGMNHPAWLLGHIAWATERGAKALTLPKETPVDFNTLGSIPGVVPASWTALFAPKTQPLADVSKYPSKEELLKTLEAVHAKAAEALKHATPEQMAKPLPEPASKRFPTVGHFSVLLMTSHESMHLGQLSAWRRAMGLPSVF